MTNDDVDNIIARTSSTSGTVFGLKDLELAAVGGISDEDFLANPYDSDSD